MNFRVRQSVVNAKPYIPGKPIEEVKRELGLKEVIKLASNENPYPPSAKVLKAISLAARSVNRYPTGDCYYLREELVRHLKVPASQLVFGNGSDELLVIAIRIFVNQGDEVIIAQPSFLIYDIAAHIAGAEVISIPLKDFCYDLEGMKRAVTARTKIIFIGNPDNPGGIYIPDNELRAFVQSLRDDILIVIDEAYYEFVSAKDYGKSLELLKEFKNVLITRTFSKMYGLAGLRVGYGIANKEVVDLINKVREPFNINSLAQAAALACLKDKAYYRNIAKKMQVQRKYLQKSLSKLGLDFVKSFTNFILIKVRQDSTDVVQAFLKKGIIIRDMNHWGLKNYIRVSVGTEKENKRFIKALEGVL